MTSPKSDPRPTEAPSPEPWKVALAEAICKHWFGFLGVNFQMQRQSEALALIQKHHDPSCPTPTRTEREKALAYWLGQMLEAHERCAGHDHGGPLPCVECGSRKALEVKP